MDMTRPLRIGILAGHKDGFENWELMVLDRIVADPRFELVTLIIHPRAFGNRKTSSLFALGARLEGKLLARQPAYTPKHFDVGRQRLDYLEAIGGRNTDNGTVAPASFKRLDLDLVIRTTPQGLPDDVIQALPFGEWAFNFSDQRSEHTDWFSYGSIIANAPTTELTLYAKRGGEMPVAEIATSSFNIKFSAARNAAFVRERAVTLLMRELARLADTRRLDAAPAARIGTTSAPSSGDLIRYAGALSGYLSAKSLKALKTKLRFGSSIWTLYTGRGRIDDFDPKQAIEIPPTKGDIKADPFLFQHNGECYLFYEAYADGDRKAHIAVGRFNGDTVERIGVALDRPHHLSYPFVFREGDDIFMMPETHQSGRLEIWRCTEFPLKWELYSTALEGQSAADSVLMRHGGKWWLFTNLSDYHAYEDHCSELYIFEVDGPELKRVVPHKRNPVVIGSTVARNAGRIFERDGRIFRPSQHNAYGIYGYGLNIMEIEHLTLDDYRERCIRTITPDFKTGLLGCHHFDAAGGRYIMDARLSI
ncbi:glucosamine inositolphosphorylceramide transferase family protein [Rhizobium sp. BR 362]|uniref:glucosamine inositolphosphorylceramide transferase family protein n=1 Tax=Rhizobium sp. BR 362 TaxID=3040670 RepID=UPI002F40C68A